MMEMIDSYRAKYVQHRALARAGMPHDGNEFPVVNRQRHTAQGVHNTVAQGVGLEHVLDFYQHSE